jgi:pyridoxine kinase
MSVLILSSHVAATPVGGSLQVAALARMGIHAALAPTVLFGRHPGFGPPGGGPVDDALFEGVLEGIEASGLLSGLKAVITGYFASAGQIAAAVRVLDRVRAASPDAMIAVDPIMGDEPKGLYVREEVAEAIASDLAPRADLVAPNAWELARLGGSQAIGKPLLTSSIAAGEKIGVLYADSDGAWLASHARVEAAPNGTGDLLIALFVAARILGHPPKAALQSAVEGAAKRAGAPGPVNVEAWSG